MMQDDNNKLNSVELNENSTNDLHDEKDNSTVELPEASPEENEWTDTVETAGAAQESKRARRKTIMIGLAFFAVLATVITVPIAIANNEEPTKKNDIRHMEYELSKTGACTKDVHICPYGNSVGRDPGNFCEFRPCPEVVACPLDLSTCPDGSQVGRTEPDCAFAECPEIVACPLDVKTCPDGITTIGRVAPDCAFEVCPEVFACPADIKKCPDGSTIIRTGPNCAFQPCPIPAVQTRSATTSKQAQQQVMCTMDAKECPDGSYVGRIAPSCAFEPCPPPALSACTTELKICPDGSSVGRSGPGCEFEPCPVHNQSINKAQVTKPCLPDLQIHSIVPIACTMELKICPDGSSLGRSGPNCEFESCPTPVACTMELKTCPGGSSVGRTGPNCEFAPCPQLAAQTRSAPTTQQKNVLPKQQPTMCTMDVKQCPDGSFVRRSGPNCEFEKCQAPASCIMGVKTCPDGSSVGRSGPKCDFEPCPTPVVCTMDVTQCADGSFVGRSAPNCEFEACPGSQ